MAGMHGRCAVAFAFAFAGFAFGSLPAGAQPAGGGSGDVEIDDPNAPPPTPPTTPTAPVKDPAVAKKWLAAAAQLVQRGDNLKRSKPDDAKTAYDNAVTAFRKAIEAGDDVNVWVPLAQTYEKLDDLSHAIAAYRVVAAATTGVKPANVKLVKARLDDLIPKVGTVTLTIIPDETTLSVDGVEAGKSPLADPIFLKPGKYKLSFSSVGYQDKEIELQVEAGSEAEKKVELDPIAIVVTKVTPKVEDVVKPLPPRGPPSRLPLYVGAGATLAFGITTLATGFEAEARHKTFVSANATPDQRFDAKINGQHLAIASDIFLGATVGAAAFTGGWYFFKYKHSQDIPKDNLLNPDAPKLTVTPWVQPGGGGFAAAGSF